ncbi:MAG: carboxypeptidase regulatory-like domain-containing protein, partial [Thermoplasmata archaeon]|nr:carboxypeptidase regulatory-like domain-containing protein [Thermoplasmata archaeon]
MAYEKDVKGRETGMVFLLMFAVFLMMAAPLGAVGHASGYTRAVGDPVSGASVMVMSNVNNYTTTDVTGYYEVWAAENITSISVSADGFFPWDGGSPPGFTPGVETQFDVTLIPIPTASCTVQGYVKDRDTGAGISDVTIYVDWGDDHNNTLYSYISTTTDSSGYYSFQVPPGDVTIWYNTGGRYQDIYECMFSIYSGTRWINQSLYPTPPAPAATAEISGYVRNSTDSAPIEGVYISITEATDSGLSQYFSATTNADGYYEIAVPPGTYNITPNMYVGNLGVWYMERDPLVVSVADGGNTTADIYLTPRPLSLVSLQVFASGGGGGLADVSVDVHENVQGNDTKYNLYLSGTTDQNGWYNFTVPDGEGTIDLTAPGYWQRTVNFTVPASGVSATLEPLVPDATVSGSFYFDGSLVLDLGGSVTATVTSPYGTYYTTAYTNTDGVYTLSLPEGDVELFYSYGSFYDRDSFYVTSGQQMTRDLYISPTWTHLYGYVTEGTYVGAPSGIPDDLDGDMMPDEWETNHSLDPTWPGDAMEDTDGDGYTNIQEYMAGTDPRDPNSNPGGAVVGPAPPPITDLAPLNAESTAITLTWTAVGLDGTSCFYEIAYADHEFSNFTDPGVSHMSGLPPASSAGTKEILTVSGLSPNTTYWFMVKVYTSTGAASYSNIVSFSTTAVLASVSADISAASGGNLSIPGAVEVIIPPGALPSDTQMTVTVEEGAAGTEISGGLYLAGDYYEIGPTGTTFNTEITIVLHYDPSALPAGTDENSLAIYRWNGASWEAIPGCVVDTTAHTVTAHIDHLSRYAVLATTEEEEGGGTGGGLGGLEDLLGSLGYIGPIPVLLLIVIIVIVVIGIASASRKRGGSAPPRQPPQPMP